MLFFKDVICTIGISKWQVTITKDIVSTWIRAGAGHPKKHFLWFSIKHPKSSNITCTQKAAAEKPPRGVSTRRRLAIIRQEIEREGEIKQKSKIEDAQSTKAARGRSLGQNVPFDPVTIAGLSSRDLRSVTTTTCPGRTDIECIHARAGPARIIVDSRVREERKRVRETDMQGEKQKLRIMIGAAGKEGERLAMPTSFETSVYRV